MGVRVMVVDDHRLLAEALASALKLRGHRVLAAAAPAAGAADLVVARAPEVCLIGTATPAEPGIFDPVVRIRAEAPQVAVVVLGPVPSPRGIAAAFAAGACGYVRHDERIEGVERAIVRACKGEAVVAPQLLAGAFAELLNPAVQPDDEGQRLLALLTPREVEVLVRVAEGEDTRVIAAGMGIAPSTARTHVQRVLMKLGVGSRLEAAALAARTGLLDRAAPPPVVPGQRSAFEGVPERPRGRRSP
ncbi:LuxR C-terminal-related transcriptional regulator [Streptomyces albidoflavus]